MSTWMGLAPKNGEKGWSEVESPRIRHITSIRVHNLTIHPPTSIHHSTAYGPSTFPSHNSELHFLPSPTAISTNSRSRRISQPNLLGISHTSGAFDTHLDETIEEEGSVGRASSRGNGESASSPVGSRPGLATTRSRSRLIVPKNGSAQSPGPGTGSYGFPSLSPTSPTPPASSFPDIATHTRHRSASISSVRSNISVMYPSHDLAYRRERAATLTSMLPTREEQVILRMKVKERLRRSFITLTLVSYNRPQDRVEGDRGGGRSIYANGDSSRARSIFGSSASTLATRARPSMSRPSSLSNSLVRSSSTQSTRTMSTSTTTSRSTSPTTPGSSPSGKGSTTLTRDGAARRVSLGKAELSHARKALGGVPIPSVGTAQQSRGGGIRPGPGRKLGPNVPSPKTSMEVGEPLKKITVPSIPTPFYISPLHRPSISPTFTSIDRRSDFADWLNVEDEAGHVVRLDVWVEKEGGRMEADNSPGWDRVLGQVVVDLRKLKEVQKEDKPLPDNTLIFKFSNRGPTQFFLPPIPTPSAPGDGMGRPETPSQPQAQDEKQAVISAAVQRSLKETRMVRGITLATLHHLVNLEAVYRDTLGSRKEISSTLDRSIVQDKTHDRSSRELNEQAFGNRRLEIAIGNVMSRCQATRASIATRRSSIQARREALSHALRGSDNLLHQVHKLDDEVSDEKSHRHAIQPATIRLRARSAQTLDYMFPILPLDPQTLLYTILSVPLPIPQTPSAAAPPISLPSGLLPLGAKVDEDSSATALGFVAIVVQVLAGLLEHQLVYPVTCVGSRSLVRDPISVINGPRSFPLYAKGVEKYRYEYAVFLLNKNIELMMVDARIRIEDMRHTLPNLKTLLLTVSAEVSSLDPSVKRRNPPSRLSSLYTFPSHSASTAVNGSPSSGSRTVIHTPGSTISQAAAKLHYIMGD